MNEINSSIKAVKVTELSTPEKKNIDNSHKNESSLNKLKSESRLS